MKDMKAEGKTKERLGKIYAINDIIAKFKDRAGLIVNIRLL